MKRWPGEGRERGSPRYRVGFSGNSMTSRERVERYLLYRAAEIAVQQGYDWFEAADRRTESRPQTIVDPAPFMRPGVLWGGDNGFWPLSWRYSSLRWGGGWRASDPFWGEPFFETRTQAKPPTAMASAEIVLHKAPSPRAMAAPMMRGRLLSSLRPEVRSRPLEPAKA